MQKRKGQSLHAGSHVQEAREVPGRKDRVALETFSRSRYTAFSRSRATEFRDVVTPACTRQRETVNRTREGKYRVKVTKGSDSRKRCFKTLRP